MNDLLVLFDIIIEEIVDMMVVVSMNFIIIEYR